MGEIHMPDRLVNALELGLMRCECRQKRLEIGGGRFPRLIQILDEPRRIWPGDVASFWSSRSQCGFREKRRVCNGGPDQFLDRETVLPFIEDATERNKEGRLKRVGV